MPDALYPPVGFYFQVRFGTQAGADASFQEASGIGPEFELEALPEGGENRYTLQLPKNVRHPKLQLKRGIAPKSSPLVAWCKSVLEGGLGAQIVPQLVQVMLFDENGQVLRSWSFANAWPVHWEVEGFNAMRGEVALEKIELSYAYSMREV